MEVEMQAELVGKHGWLCSSAGGGTSALAVVDLNNQEAHILDNVVQCVLLHKSSRWNISTDIEEPNSQEAHILDNVVHNVGRAGGRA